MKIEPSELVNRMLQRLAAWQGLPIMDKGGCTVIENLQKVCVAQQMQIEALASMIKTISPGVYSQVRVNQVSGWDDVDDVDEPEPVSEEKKVFVELQKAGLMPSMKGDNRVAVFTDLTRSHLELILSCSDFNYISASVDEVCIHTL